MTEKEIEIKTTDKTLLEQAKRMVGYRMILDDLAIQYAEASNQFWTRARKLHPEIKLEEQWTYNHYAKTFQKR